MVAVSITHTHILYIYIYIYIHIYIFSFIFTPNIIGGDDSQFDDIIFFIWVETKPPTRNGHVLKYVDEEMDGRLRDCGRGAGFGPM